MDGVNLKIEYLPVEALKPYERNARKHDAVDIGAIASSIDQFGFDDPIGIWGPDNIIVEGHGRLMAAKERGMDKVPCIRLDHLTDEQRRAYALAHNRTAELSTWDELLKGAEVTELAALGVADFEALGFEAPKDTDLTEAVEDEFDETLPEEPTTKRGEIYQLGRHRLMCGDALSLSDVQLLTGGGAG